MKAPLPGFFATHHHVTVITTADGTSDLSTDVVANDRHLESRNRQPIDAAHQRIAASDG